MAADACECGGPTSGFVIEREQPQQGRMASYCPWCKRKYSFVKPSDPGRIVRPPMILKTHMEGDVIFVDHWQDSQGEVGG